MFCDKELNDIIENDSKNSYIFNEILRRFYEKQNKKLLNDNQKRNLEVLCKLFVTPLNKDINVPIVADIDMGEGKSSMLLEYVKYMCEIDKTFSAIIVKKTIEECQEFIIELGLKPAYNEGFGSYFDKENFNIKQYYTTHEDDFIGRALRSINTKECKLYDYTQSNEFVEEFSPVLCSSCEHTDCPVIKARNNQKNHRILAITHARLFLTNTKEDIFNQIEYWVDEKGEKRKRNLLIIDEKINTVEIGTFTFSDWDKIKNNVVSFENSELTQQVNHIDGYLDSLKTRFPDNSQENLDILAYEKDFKFSREIASKLLGKQKSTKFTDDLEKVEKFINLGGTVSRDWRDNNELFNYHKYTNTQEYVNNLHMPKCLILDATSRLDKDYCKADFLHVREIQRAKKFNITIIANNNVTASKSSILSSYSERVKLLAKDITNVINKAPCKTLIVAYKEIKTKNRVPIPFKIDLDEAIIALKPKNEYKVIHFGQYTTGVNTLQEYETIVFVGLLNKDRNYYANKNRCIGCSEKEIKINEHLIDTIQQIGRTAVRQDKKVDVYMLGANKELIKELESYFSITSFDWYNQHYCKYNLASEDAKKDAWYLMAEYIFEHLVNVGDRIKKSEVKNFVANRFDLTVHAVRKAMKSHTFRDVIKTKGIFEDCNNVQYLIKLE